MTRYTQRNGYKTGFSGRQFRRRNDPFGFFKFFFAVIFCFIMVVAGVSAYLGYNCYSSGDRNSMACYMMSDRLELGIRGN